MSSKFLKSLSILFLVMMGSSGISFASTESMPTAADPREEKRPIIVMLVRHLQTQSNVQGKTHGTEGGQLDAESSGEGMSSLVDFAARYSENFQGLYCGTDFRHYSTLSTIALKATKEVKEMPNFDEFNLGVLKGLSEKEVQKRPEFANMFTAPDREVPGGDSINLVKSKFIEGLGHVVREAIRDGNGGINMICTSRITMNIALRFLLQNDKFLNPKIPNCGAYIFKYTPDGTELDSRQVNCECFELLNGDVEVLNGDTVIPGIEMSGKGKTMLSLNHDGMLQAFAKQHAATEFTSVTPAPIEKSDEEEMVVEANEKEIVIEHTEEEYDTELDNLSDPEDSSTIKKREKKIAEPTETEERGDFLLPVARLSDERARLEFALQENQADNLAGNPTLVLRRGLTQMYIRSPLSRSQSDSLPVMNSNLRPRMGYSQESLPYVADLHLSPTSLPSESPADLRGRSRGLLETLYANFTPPL